MKKTSLLLALLAVCAAGAAQADGFYAGATVGTTNYQNSTLDAKGNPVSLDKETAGKAFVGYQINRNIGVEGGYVDLGSSQNIKGQGGYAALVGTVPVANNLDVFGKVGVAQLKAKGALDDTNKTGGNYGVGATYHINRNVAVRGEVERFDNVGTDLKANVASAGVQYNF